MFGFPTDLFGVPNGNTRRTNNNALLPQQPSLFGNSLMVPSPFAGVSNFFGDFGLGSPPFAMMDRLMHDANQDSTAPVHSFTSTTVMSFNGPDGRPKVYQETTSRNRGPGGIEETRQAVRDTERGINKVQIGHRIGDRKHVIEREMNVQTGQISENVELDNLDEDETDDFKKEWRQRSAHAGLFRHAHHPYHTNHHPPQLTSHRLHVPSSTGSHPAQLAIEHGPSASVSSSRPHSKPSRHQPNSAHRPPLQQSDTIDLTEDTPAEADVEEIQQLSSPKSSAVKRKASTSSSSGDTNHQRKHRQNRI